MTLTGLITARIGAAPMTPTDIPTTMIKTPMKDMTPMEGLHLPPTRETAIRSTNRVAAGGAAPSATVNATAAAPFPGPPDLRDLREFRGNVGLRVFRVCRVCRAYRVTRGPPDPQVLPAQLYIPAVAGFFPLLPAVQFPWLQPSIAMRDRQPFWHSATGHRESGIWARTST